MRGLSELYCYSLSNDYKYMIKRTGSLFPDKDKMEELYSAMLKRKLSPARLGNIIKMFKHYCAWADKGLPDVKAPRDTGKRIVFLTEMEATMMLHKCINYRDYAILCLLLYGGLRRSEVVNLKLHDLDLENRIITVRTTKTHIEAESIISKKVVGALKDWLKRRPEVTHDYVFTSRNGGKIGPDRITRLVKEYANKAGIKKNVTAHVLRHTLATNLLTNGADISFVQKQLRHRNIQSTLVYLHITTEKQKEMYDRFCPSF